MSVFLLRYLNDLYILNLSDEKCPKWEIPETFGTIPSPRESHVCVVKRSCDGSLPKLLIYGGMSGNRLGDIWILDIGRHILHCTLLRKTLTSY